MPVISDASLDGRNHFVDFLRGLAAINIVLIHTAFWSGMEYVPVWFENITLLLDVPMFFFIAGWAFSYSSSFEKSLMNVFRTHLKYTIFLALYTITIFIFHRAELSAIGIVESFFFVFPAEELFFPVVRGSIWFLPIFYGVSALSSGAIVLVNRLSPDWKTAGRILRMITVAILFLFAYLSLGHQFAVLNQTLLFYTFFFMFGYLGKDIAMSRNWQLAIVLSVLLAGIGAFFFHHNGKLPDLQQCKFPPTPLYLLVSLIGVAIVLRIKQFIHVSKQNIVTWVGQNAIYFYLAQGVSSSILFFVIPLFPAIPWYLMFLICAAINLAGTFAIALLLKSLGDPADRFFAKLTARHADT